MRLAWTFFLVILFLMLVGCGSPAAKTPDIPTKAPDMPTATPSREAQLLAKIGHGAIHDILYTQDGKFILAAFGTGLGALDARKLEIVSFWDLPVAALRLALLAEKEISILTADGQILFVGFDPLTGALNASSRTPLPSEALLSFEDAERLYLAASPDGRYLAFSGAAGGAYHIRVWNLETGQVIWKPASNPSMPDELSFSSDSQYLLLGESGGLSYSAENVLVHLADGQIVWSAKGDSWLLDGKTLVHWPSPDAYRLAALSAPDQGNLMPMPQKVRGGRWFVSPDGETLAHLDDIGQVRLMDLQKQRVASLGLLADVGRYNFFENPLYLSNANKVLTFMSRINTVKAAPGGKPVEITYSLLLVDSQLSFPIKELTPPFRLSYPLPVIHFAPDGLSCVYSQGSRLVRVEFSTQEIVTFSDQLSSGVTALAFAPDGKTLAMGSQDFTVTYFDLAQKLKEIRRESLQVSAGVNYRLPGASRWYNGVSGLVFSGDGEKLAAGSSNGFVYLLALDGSRPPLETPLDGEITGQGGLVEIFGLAASPKSGTLATGGYERAVRLWNNFGATGPDPARLDDSSVVTVLAYTPDGERLVAGTENGPIHLWRTDGTLERTLNGHSGRVTGLVVAEKTLVTAAEDGTIRFWNLVDGSQTRSLNLGVQLTSLALDGRGELLAAGTQNGKTWLWGLTEGRWLGQISAAGIIRALAFSPDSSHLVLGSEGGQLQLWRVRLADGQVAQFPTGEPQNFIPTCRLGAKVTGFQEGLFVAGSRARLEWEIPFQGDCSGLDAASLHSVNLPPGLAVQYSLKPTFDENPRLQTLHIYADVMLPAAPGAYTYAWELTAPDGKPRGLTVRLTVLETSPATQPLPAPLYFISESGSLLRLETDARTLTALVEAPVACMDISPSSGEIAYQSGDALWLADLNGGNRRLLLPIGGCPSWSTDGKWIGFIQNGVKVVNLASGEIRTLALDVPAFGKYSRRYQRVLDWSPFSNKFIASVSGWEWVGLQVFDLPTGDKTGLTGFSNPSWSLNGEFIYTGTPQYSGYTGQPPYLLRTSVLTNQVETLLGNTESDLTGAFAPFETADGRLLAFVGQADSPDAPLSALAAAQVSLETPGQFTYDPNPHPIFSPVDVVWWRDGSQALVKLTDGEVLITYPFSQLPNIYLPVRGTDFRWNRFAPAVAFTSELAPSAMSETVSSGGGVSGYALAYLGGAEGKAPQLIALRSDGSGRRQLYPSLALSSPPVKFGWDVDGERLFALTEEGDLYHVRPLDNRFYEFVTPEGLPGYVSAGDGLVKDFSLSPDGRYLAIIYNPRADDQFDLPNAEQRIGRDNLGVLDLQQKRWVDVDIPAISNKQTGQAAILFSVSSWSKDSRQLVVSVTQNPAGLVSQSAPTSVAFVSYHAAHAAGAGTGAETVGLLVADVHGKVRNITLSTPADEDSISEFYPFWAADGQIYFYSVDRNDNPGLYRINPNGKGQTHLADCEAMDLTVVRFAVSPNGKYLVVRTSSDDGSFHWAVIDTSDGKKTFLPFDAETVDVPVWSPDGDKLAWFVLDDTLTPKIILLDAANGSQSTLALPTGLTEVHALTWAPDGQALAFRSYLPAAGLRLYILPVDGTASQIIASDILDHGALIWSPR